MYADSRVAWYLSRMYSRILFLSHRKSIWSGNIRYRRVHRIESLTICKRTHGLRLIVRTHQWRWHGICVRVIAYSISHTFRARLENVSRDIGQQPRVVRFVPVMITHNDTTLWSDASYATTTKTYASKLWSDPRRQWWRFWSSHKLGRLPLKLFRLKLIFVKDFNRVKEEGSVPVKLFPSQNVSSKFDMFSNMLSGIVPVRQQKLQLNFVSWVSEENSCGIVPHIGFLPNFASFKWINEPMLLGKFSTKLRWTFKTRSKGRFFANESEKFPLKLFLSKCISVTRFVSVSQCVKQLY